MPRSDNLRINVFLGLILVFSSLVGYKLFNLSIVKHSHYARTAQAQSENISNVLARGNIYITDKANSQVLLATNKKFPLVYVIPSQIKAELKNDLALQVSQILEVDAEELKQKFNSSSSSTKVISRKISDDKVSAIKALGVKAIGISYETDRFYPGDDLAADIIGFMGYDADGKRSGQYGVESFYDADLFGKDTQATKFFESANPLSFFSKIIREEKKDDIKDDVPSDIFLTIDKNIQVFIESKLQSLLNQWQYEKASIIVQEPQSGKILAMADWPTFDPNNYSKSKTQLFLNSSTQEIFEPGSSFKPFTMAIGLDLGKITPQTTYEDTGSFNIAGYEIKNFDSKAHGKNTMTEVLQHSLNTGTMFVQGLVGNDDYLDYLINMGFGQKTDVDLPGELSGDVTNLYSGRKINFLTASFGQGIAVTPIQLVNAFSMIANGGKLMKPFIVSKIVKENGQVTENKPEIVGIPITDKTANKLKTMLVGVVDNGYDKKAKIDGYDVAGKTGTAQIPTGSGGYLEGEFIHSFAGFAPASNPAFTILIKMDKPKGTTFASNSLSVTFREITDFLLKYYNIPPTTN